MSENKRKRTEDHYAAQCKTPNQSQQQQLTSSQTIPLNSILQQSIIVNPIITTHTEQANESEQLQLLNTSLMNNQNNNAQSNLLYLIVPQGVNQTQNLVQGVQTVLLVPKDDQDSLNFIDGQSQVQYCLSYDNSFNIDSSEGKKTDDDVIFVEDSKLAKHEPAIPIEYTQPTLQQRDPLQIQNAPNIDSTVLPRYGEPALSSDKIFVLNNKQFQKIQQNDNDGTVKPKAQFKCDFPNCILSFPSLYEKKMHSDTHFFKANSEFKCHICDLKFTTGSERSKHIDSHSVVSTYSCKWCNKDFPYYISLVKHTNEEKCPNNTMHTCHYCGVQFVELGDLEKHQKENIKRCVCNTKICSDQAFELHTTLCSLYKHKIKNIKKVDVQSKQRSSNDVIVLDD